MDIPTVNINLTNNLPAKENVSLYLHVDGIIKCSFPQTFQPENFDYIKYNLYQSIDKTFIFNDYKWEIVNLSHVLNDIVNKRLISSNYFFIFCFILSHFATVINNAELLHLVKQISSSTATNSSTSDEQAIASQEHLLTPVYQQLILALNDLIKIYLGTYVPIIHNNDEENIIIPRSNDYDSDDEVVNLIEKELAPLNIPQIASAMKPVNMLYISSPYDDEIPKQNDENKSYLNPIITLYTSPIEFSKQILDHDMNKINIIFTPISIKKKSNTTVIIGHFESVRLDIVDNLFVLNYLELQNLIIKHIDKEAKVEILFEEDKNLLKITVSNKSIEQIYVRLEYWELEWLQD
jgi:hypothetical protein